MKKNIIVFALLTGILSVSSCKEILDTTPTKITLETYFTNESELNNMLNSVYDAMNGGNFYQATYQTWVAQGTDESYRRTGVTSISANNYKGLPNDSQITGLWSSLYIGINRANTILENIDNVPNLTTERKNIFLGETKFLRAYYLFMATSWWGDVPLRIASVKSPNDTDIAFTPSKEVYDFVIAEMTEAEGLLSKQTPSTIVPYQNGRVTNTIVQGILARVCLYAAGNPVNDTKRYAEAKVWAEKVIKSGIHKLNPDYAQVFREQSAGTYDPAYKESMWEAEFAVDNSNPVLREALNANDMIAPQINANTLIGKTLCSVAPTAKLYRVYPSYYNAISLTDMSPDKRRDRNVANFTYAAPSGSTTSTPPIINPFTWNVWWARWPGKWLRADEINPQANGSSQNWPILRYADVLLMFAEADFKATGQVSSESIAAINQLRARAYGSLTSPIKNGIELTLANTGSGYTIAPTAIATIGGSSTTLATIGTTISAGKITSLIMSNPGEYASLPSTIYLGTPWVANTALVINTNIVNPNNGLLYKVTTAGTTTNIPPTNTTGASSAASTGAVFTYIGTAATATATITTGLLKPEEISTGAFMETIMQERMKELCYEGFRRKDLIRWNILVPKVKEISDLALNGSIERFYNNTQIIPPAATSSSLRVIIMEAGLNVSDKWVYLPIPNSEIANNRLAKQNKGF
ncbi:hypothetical protein ADIARSV_1552 [Arcticibacter svalbardensis MN12-7]|uniref:Outer membrane protein n=1 Tax=Arcticibacter svalbardensis MN12-7 TaxID=1150600 RepID=R9GUT1_9SPHI|nr:RagB/SusD family nutrient uptake outer membrane protein [Arcticibacter svalbardensis]EOR95275.1 hypothetical protein ADIARSV_1552 [Arcticibacter svalbardensis MN12-7]